MTLLRWLGSKKKVLNVIFSHFPIVINNYYEPFVGGGSVLLETIARVKDGRIKMTGEIYASDSNERLINMYINIKERPNEVIDELKKIETMFNACKPLDGQMVLHDPVTLEDAYTSHESLYYWLRKQFNQNHDYTSTYVSAIFIYLNKTGFRGMYRENSRKIFNIPYEHGQRSNAYIFDTTGILSLSEKIQNVHFICRSFKDSPLFLANDFMYLDPPYVLVSPNSFNIYTSDKFTMVDHMDVFTLCKQLSIQFIMSNSNTPLVLENFPSDQYLVISLDNECNMSKSRKIQNDVLICKVNNCPPTELKSVI
jgi:DNA adenine methylase